MVTKPKIHLTSITFSGGDTINLYPNEKLIVVGPNNSGKSLALREILATLSSRTRVSSNLVIQSVQLEKVVEEGQFESYLRENGTFEGNQFKFDGQYIHISAARAWGGESHLEGTHTLFVKLITAENRLNAAKLQDSQLPGRTPNNPQQVLYTDETLFAKLSGEFEKAFGKELFFNFRGGPKLPIHVGVRPEVDPNEDRVSDSYVSKVEAQPALHEQGDGIKSYAGLIFETLTQPKDLYLIDEPEAFLHPPQKRKLGEVFATEIEGQAIVASHSSDILRGFLTGQSSKVRIARIQQINGKNFVSEPSAESIRTLWEQPDLRYSNALDGIFHEQVIICEDDSDCRLYNAMSDHLEKQSGKKWLDTAYVPAGGKDAIPRIAEILHDIGVPVKMIFDIDFLSDAETVKKAVLAVGGDWSKYESDQRIVDRTVRDGSTKLAIPEVKDEIIKLLGSTGKNELPKSKIADLMKQTKAWGSVKKSGKMAIPNGDATVAYNRLSRNLKKVGIFVVGVGEAENFCTEVGGHGPRYVQALLKDIPLDDERLAQLRAFVEEFHSSEIESHSAIVDSIPKPPA